MVSVLRRLIAIKKALEYIITMVPRNENFLICSDSLSGLQSLKNNNCFNMNPLVVEILNLHNEISQLQSNVSFLWVPSHCSILGNERVNEIIKDLTVAEDLTHLATPYPDFKSYIFKILEQERQDKWTLIENNKLRSIKAELKIWESSYMENRRDEVVLCRMRICIENENLHSKLFCIKLLKYEYQ